jgi:hypothetical protein
MDAVCQKQGGSVKITPVLLGYGTFMLFGNVCIWLILYAYPLYPPFKRIRLKCPIFRMFERGKKFERGLRPLSSKLPFPAIKIIG